MPTNKLLDKKLKAVLKYNVFMCRLCETNVDMVTKIATDAEKTKKLTEHIDSRHRSSTHIDPHMDRKYYPLYCRPQVVKTNPNEKFL